MDKLTLSQMQVFGYHGVFPEENKLGQRFIIDVEMGMDLSKAGTSDDLNQTINYADVYYEVQRLAEGKPFKLIEALAENIASHMLSLYTDIQMVTVKVTKPHPPFKTHFAGVTAEIHRKRV